MNRKAIINIGKGQIGMDDDAYRAMLFRVTGLDSLRAMSAADQDKVIAELKRMGFRDTRGNGSYSKKPYVRLIHALWKSCHETGGIEDGSKKALRSFVLKMTDSADPEFLSYAQATPVIEALKAIEKRAKAGART